jgi:KTSC domain/DnaJ domain
MTPKEAKIELGITQEKITSEELKKIYKKEILKWHPDVATNYGISNEEATRKTQRIILSFEILSKNLDSLDSSDFTHTYESYYTYRTSKPKNYKQYYDYSIDDIDESFINRTTLKSSNVKWVDYITDLQILVVRFKDSSVYFYFDVPKNVHNQFQKSDSPGRFVNQNLRGYKYERMNNYADWLNLYKSLSEIEE